jgi:hypothetical protein
MYSVNVINPFNNHNSEVRGKGKNMANKSQRRKKYQGMRQAKFIM